jgi:putative endonuclease
MSHDRVKKKPQHMFVYMLECENGSYYTGSTDDPARRYEEHLKGTARAKYTRSFKPVRMARCWRLSGARGAAIRIERLVQGLSRKEKDAIVAEPGMLGGMVRERYGEDYGIMPHNFNECAAHTGEGRCDIAGYVPAEGEWNIRNPYLEEVLSFIEDNAGLGPGGMDLLLGEKRSGFVSRYAFSIPTIGIIDEIARHSPLVEIGAGGGYWAMCLRDAGADIIAYDRRPPGDEPPWEWREANQWFDDTWFLVHEGDETMAGRYPERSLFLCWPPIFDPMAVSALRSYREAGGKTLVYVGSPGSSADESFFDELKSLKMIVSLRIPSWPGMEEWLMIYDLT